MKKLNLIGLLALVIIVLTGCADVSHVQDCLQVTEHTYGFWGGTWHGMITFFSFIGSLLDDEIAVYAVNNNGAWYDFGFIGGAFIMVRILRAIILNRHEK